MENKDAMTKMVTIRVPNEMYKRIENKNKSEYIRRLIDLQNTPSKSENVLKELLKMNFQLKKIGNNINQIVKNNNSKLYNENDKKQLVNYFDVINEKYSKLIETLKNMV